MPLFGGSKRPKLDGLTKEEEKRRDALNPIVLQRAGEKGVAGQAPAAVALLRERMAEEPRDPLWPLLLGWQLMGMRRFDQAIEAFQEAIQRDKQDVRGYFGAGHSFFEVAEMRQQGTDAIHQLTGVAQTLTVDNLYNEALRSFRAAFDMTDVKEERDKLRSAISVVEKALAKKAGRL